jgi:hypothetical protein
MTAAQRERRSRLGVIAALGIVVVVLTAGALTALGRDPSSNQAQGEYVDIGDVPLAEAPATEAGPDPATGRYTSDCGRNEDGHNNWDNVVSSPDERDAAQHLHEYVGNTATDAYATDERLEDAGTTCSDGDASAYYWPALRSLEESGGSTERFGNEGRVLRPDSVDIEYRGNAVSQVVPMPRFLRLVTGDSRAATTTTPAGVPQWSCAGDEARHTPLYPLCPDRHVVRTFEFPSCWDGRRLDSADHRSHVVFPAANGACPADTFAIPQLRLRVTYVVPPGRSFAIDTFPEQRRSPRTDHADFINVMPESLMEDVTGCINEGRRC